MLLNHFSRVRLCVTPETAAHQAPPSLGFSRQEYWRGLPFPSQCMKLKSESEGRILLDHFSFFQQVRSRHSTSHGSLVGMHCSVKGAFPVRHWFTLCGNSVSKADGREWCRVGEALEDEATF